MFLVYCVKYLKPILNIQYIHGDTLEDWTNLFESFPLFLSNRFQYLHVRQSCDVIQSYFTEFYWMYVQTAGSVI